MIHVLMWLVQFVFDWLLNGITMMTSSNGNISALLDRCAENSPVTGEVPSQRLVTRDFDIFFDVHLNKRLSKQSWWWWLETSLRSLWRHCNANSLFWMNVFSVLLFSMISTSSMYIIYIFYSGMNNTKVTDPNGNHPIQLCKIQDPTSPVLATESIKCSLKANHDLICWGYN